MARKIMKSARLKSRSATKSASKHASRYAKPAKSRAKAQSKPHHESSLKEDILSVNNTEQDYDKIFEQKLAENYKIFKELKEHRIQIRKFGAILVFVLIIILVALLLLTFS